MGLTGPVAALRAAWEQAAIEANTIPDDPADVDLTYVAGPMTGYVDYNYPAFNAKAAELRAAGHTVVNPAELHEPGNHPNDWYYRRDLAQLIKCNRIVLLPDWWLSRGACLEHYVARALGMEIVYPAKETAA